MINEKELRDNNYYLFSGKSEGLYDYKKKVGRVRLNEIYDFYVEFTNISNEMIDHFKKENINPIPLTKKILLKCGFKMDKRDYNWFKLKNCPIQVFDDCEQVCYENFLLDLKIKYLHQLQNLHYALTKTELEVKL